MKDYAKREELTETTLNLERAQAEIRYVVKTAVINNTPWNIVDGIIGDIVKRYTKDIDDEEFKIKAVNSLLAYATVAYRRLQEQFAGMNIALLSAVMAYTAKETSSYKREKALQTILREEQNILPTETEPTEYVETAQAANEWSETYMKRVNTAWRELAESEAKDSYSDRVSLRNIAEMKERWDKKQSEIQELVDDGTDLVWIDNHANCSERCQKWQGKLYSISGRSGTIDGIPFQPLANATDIYTQTKAGKVYKNGCISGFNCRHRLTKYSKGNKPIEVSAETIERARTINDTQRAYEREIRDNKALAIGLKDVDPQQAKEYVLQARKLTQEYEEYSKKNEVAFYPSRCRVFDGEELVSARYRRLLGAK